MSGRAALQHPGHEREPERQFRNVGHHREEDQHGDEPGPGRNGELGDAHARDAGGDIEIEADRRMAEADLHVHRHQDAEMHRVDAEAHRDRKQNRRGDQHDR